MLSWSSSIDLKGGAAGVSIVVSGTESVIGTLRGRGIEEALVEEEKGVVSKKVTSVEKIFSTHKIIAAIIFLSVRITNKHTANKARRKLVQIGTSILDKTHTIKNLRG